MPINYCLNCNKEIPSVNKYCSNKCQQVYEQKQWEEKWFAGEVSGNKSTVWIDVSKRVRTYLFKKYDNKCAICGWGEINPFTGKIPLEVEHIDGDPYNTVPDNVTLLCPNCHSLTATYRGANRGKGRKKTWVPKSN
jgi:predicted restriction endonuclease